MQGGKGKKEKVRDKTPLNPQLKAIGDQIGNKLDTRVSIELGKEKGKITIEFADEEDLKRIAQLLK